MLSALPACNTYKGRCPMIRKAGPKDGPIIEEFLKREESFNTGSLCTIERYGFEKAFHDVWLQESRDGCLTAVYIRLFGFMHLFWPNAEGCEEALEEAADFLTFMGSGTITGNWAIIQKLSPFFTSFTLEQSRHMVLEGGERLVDSFLVRTAGSGDCGSMARLIMETEDFARFYHTPQEVERGMRQRLELGLCRYYLIERDGILAAQAHSTAETRRYATVGGVVTRRYYRGQGLSAQVVSALCRDLLKSGLRPELSCTDDTAARLYDKLGFIHVSNGGLLVKKRQME